MRIGCLQFAPQVGDVDNNLNRADAVLSRANPDDLDVLVLPELAFSGYNFKSLQDISPFLEPSGSGISSLWARTMALKYNCTVLVGYPEKVDVSPNWPTGPEYYNSAIVVNGDGETIANYRKSFLYYTDESWALEGNRGFYDGYIPGLGNTSIGICMDINPYKFEAPWHAFEFAFHVLEVESNLVIVSMAWMTREDRRHFSRMPNEPDMNTLTYWVTRLEPLIRSNNEDEIIVVFCNRTGIEDEATYAGTSAVIGIQEGEVKVYGLLGRGEKELLVVDTTNPPYAKMVYRPDAAALGKQVGELEHHNASNARIPPLSERTYTKPDNGSLSRKTDSNIDSLDLKATDYEQHEQSVATGRGSAHDFPTSSPPASMAHHPSSTEPTSPPAPSFSMRSEPLSHSQLTGHSQPKASSKQHSKRRTPSISIPSPFKSADHGQAASNGEGNDVPTPSAPSPTPLAVRPRLVIPQLPSLVFDQHSENNIPSASSIRSAESSQSIKSDESEVSTQTIRSNPRPPEDSTPYPQSGLPLSGYPSNSFQHGFEKRIYGGNVTIKHETDALSPTTPFDDVSTGSPRWFWRPHDSVFRSSVSGGGNWATSTPVGRKPEPFPWSAIKDVTSLPRNTSENEISSGASGPTSTRSKYSQSPRSNTSSNKTGKANSSTETKMPQQTNSQNEKHPSRPSSPKSRNASRSGIRGRSDSSLSPQNIPSAVSQHIEQISQRAESRNRHNSDPQQFGSAVDRCSSQQMRNDGWHKLTSDSATEHLIPIAASPSLLGPGSRANISTPAAIDYYRHATSRTTPHNTRLQHFDGDHQRGLSDNKFVSGHQAFGDDTKRNPLTAPTSRDITTLSSRSVSRGRQPNRKNDSFNAAMLDPGAERATSADSTRNNILHTRIGKRHSYDKDIFLASDDGHSHIECSHTQNNRDESKFERVEVISCPSCPVHGRQSTSLSEPTRQERHTNQDATPERQLDLIYSTVTERAEGKKAEADKAPGREATTGHMLTGANSQIGCPTANQQMPTKDSAMFKDTGHATSSSGPDPSSTIPRFDPTTPRAMMFHPNDTCIDSLPTADLRGSEQPPNWFTVEKKSQDAEFDSTA
ncbi:Protein Amidase [Trichoderma ghanense]|uniref:Protein Amidase n=1 Tax=Trichoderma ghanense TaxID=65468 RepID=A0ABY2H6A7_9HYPO